MENTIKYIFDNELYTLFEIKYHYSKETDKSKLYQWFFYDKMNDTLQKLDFLSMTDNERIFEQGKLYFNNVSATYEYDNNQIQLNSLIPSSKKSNNLVINIFAKQITNRSGNLFH